MHGLGGADDDWNEADVFLVATNNPWNYPSITSYPTTFPPLYFGPLSDPLGVFGLVSLVHGHGGADDDWNEADVFLVATNNPWNYPSITSYPTSFPPLYFGPLSDPLGVFGLVSLVHGHGGADDDWNEADVFLVATNNPWNYPSITSYPTTFPPLYFGPLSDPLGVFGLVSLVHGRGRHLPDVHQ